MYEPKLRKRKNGLPIMSNAEIEFHVEEFLKDYNPSLLSVPQPVDIEKFAEIYLDLSLDYLYLSHCGLILGRMVFQEIEMVPVYLPKEKRAEYLYVERGTMLIDNTVLEDYKEYRLRSTIGHECGHWVFHSDYCLNARHRQNRQNEMPDYSLSGCTKTDIEGGMETSGRRKLVTDMDWLEHQAKYFGAAILMPKTPFINAVSELDGCGNISLTDMSNTLSNLFQVSPMSARIRLSQLGFKYTERNTRDSTEELLTHYRRYEAFCE